MLYTMVMVSKKRSELEAIRDFDAEVIPVIDRLVSENVGWPKAKEVLEIVTSERYD